MRMCELAWPVLAAALVLAAAQPVDAQSHERVGTRAQGMAGAFVAVADDASAAWWNPAGLAAGALVSAVVEKGRMDEPGVPRGREPALRAATSGFAFALPSLGLNFYRLRIAEAGSVVTASAAGLDPQSTGMSAGQVRVLSLTQLGVTVGQSVGDHLVLGSTLKLLRGGTQGAAAESSLEGLDLGDGLDIEHQGKTDLDVGVMFSSTHLRAGLSVRNLREPEFGSGTDRLKLSRRVRAGMAVTGSVAPALDAVTVAADADVNRTSTLIGEVRHVAAGAEIWAVKRRLGLRAGVTANTVGPRRPSTSMGLSIAAFPGMYFDAARTLGSDSSIRGWSTTLRVTY